MMTACGPQSPEIDDKAAGHGTEAGATHNPPELSRVDPAPAKADRTTIQPLDTPAPATPASLSLTCPEASAARDGSQRVEFGYQYEVEEEATVSISYGDGDTYSTSRQGYFD